MLIIGQITSRYDGVIKHIHYEAEEMAQVGKVILPPILLSSHADVAKPLCDIDVQDDNVSPDEGISEVPETVTFASSPRHSPRDAHQHQEPLSVEDKGQGIVKGSAGKNASLATPAVRGLLKELNVKIEDVVGTGKDGRVMKEDVQKFGVERERVLAQVAQEPSSYHQPIDKTPQEEKRVPLTRIQSHMFNAMTRSLTIPHFLYADEINLTPLSAIRQTLNVHGANPQKLSFLPFIIQALSLALSDFPLLNSRVETNGSDSPQIIMRSHHNIGVAMDTPQGLLVPNIKHVSSLNIYSIAAELSRLQQLGQAGKFSVSDLSGGTITVSNIGSIGGTYVAPLLVPGEVAILGVGRSRIIPAFDDRGAVVQKEVVNFSWSADHRIVDGATMARMAERVRGYVEDPGTIMARLR
jgi:2-oxoisovalerate dehydrogenase E2 component (dihydrolipoyl transacylase)